MRSLSASAVVAFAAALPCQRAGIPAADLLCERVERTPYLAPIRIENLIGARRFAGEDHLRRRLFDEPERAGDFGWRGAFTQDQLAVLLDALGAEPDLVVGPDAVYVDVADADAMRTLLDELRRALPPPITVDVRLTQTNDGATVTRFAGEVQLTPGRLHVFGDVVERSAVVDYEVEIAQASTLANPVVGDVREGVMIALRPQLAPGGAWALLETVARCIDGDPDARIETGHPGIGPIDRVPMAISESGHVALVRPGARTVQRWSGPHGAFELAMTTQWKLPAPVRPGGRDLGIFTMRSPTGGFRSLAVPHTDESDRGRDGELERSWDDPSELAGGGAQWLGLPEDDPQPDVERYLVVGEQGVASAAAVRAWFEARPLGPELHMRCFDVPVGTPWPIPAGREADARAVGSARLAQVEGTWSATAVHSESTVLRDWDSEVAQAARIPDPRCERVSAGFVVNARMVGGLLDLELEVSRIVDPGQKELQLSSALLAPEVSTLYTTVQGRRARTTDFRSPPLVLPADRVVVEQPVRRSIDLQLRRHVAADAPIVHRVSATGAFGPGRELLLVVEQLP